MSTSGVIKLGDSVGLYGHIHLSDVLGTAELDAFGNALIPYTSATILKLSFTETNVVSLPGVGIGSFDIRTLGVVYFRDLDQPGKMIRFTYPCPSLGDFDHIQYVGHRMSKPKGDALAALFSALTGKNLQFSEGSIT